jgi:membrane-associated phospholipid phosphatase
MNEKNYKIISDWFRKSKVRLKAFNIIYRLLPLVVVVAYCGIILYAFLCLKREEFIRIIIVPMVAFVLCTIVRYVINEERPYEALDINPLISKNKKRQSFPSRHVLSACIIAMSGLYVNVALGSALMMLSLIIAAIRPIAGVHYVRDVLAGLIMGIVCGIIGFWII